MHEYRRRSLRTETAALHRFAPVSIATNVAINQYRPLSTQNIFGAISTSTAEGTTIDVREYDFDSNTWHSFKKFKIDEPMQEYGLAVISDKIFAMGGKGKRQIESTPDDGFSKKVSIF